jgi:uncharacterized Fe-S cluster-containing MiaB family protein
MREAAHRVKTERAWRLRDSVVVISTSIGCSGSWATVFYGCHGCSGVRGFDSDVGLSEKMNDFVFERHGAFAAIDHDWFHRLFPPGSFFGDPNGTGI